MAINLLTSRGLCVLGTIVGLAILLLLVYRTYIPRMIPEYNSYYKIVKDADEYDASNRKTILVTAGGHRLKFINLDVHHGTSLDIGSMVISRGGEAALTQNAWHTEWLTEEIKGRLRYLHLAQESVEIIGRLQASNKDSFNRQLFYSLKNNSDIISADAFICSFPSALCESLFSFNKTVIFAPGLRFSFQRCTKKLWQDSIEIMQRAAVATNPRHFVAALSRYDAEYIRYFTGLKALPLYSSSQSYLPHLPYKPTRPEIIIGPLAYRIQDSAIRGVDKEFVLELVKRPEFNFSTAKALYKGRFSLTQIMDHRAAVVFPYAVMSYGFTELYALGIPLFFPSEALMMSRHHLYPNDRTMTGKNKTYKYCGIDHGIVPPRHASCDLLESPESLTPAAKSYWLKFADFHQWPHITFFNSIPDLITKLQKADFAAVHKLMVLENLRREAKLDKVWREIAAGMNTVPRSMPERYQHSPILPNP